MVNAVIAHVGQPPLIYGVIYYVQRISTVLKRASFTFGQIIMYSLPFYDRRVLSWGLCVIYLFIFLYNTSCFHSCELNVYLYRLLNSLLP